MKYEITVVTAIYNSENYIEKCVRSLFEQSFKNIEFIFIDDGSTDQSVLILENLISEYSYRKNNITIINLTSNNGPAYVKQLGINNAKGKYIICIDSDDYVEKEMLAEMHAKAVSNHAEIVTCYVMLEYKDRSLCNKEFTSDNFEDRMREIILNEHTNGYLCNKLVLKDLYLRSNCFPPKSMRYLEDLYIVTRLYFNAKLIIPIHKAYYHYVKYNVNSITNSDFHKLYKSHKLYWKLQEEFYKKNNLETTYASEISSNKTLSYLNLIFRIQNISKYINFGKEINQLNLQPNTKLKIGQIIILYSLNKKLYILSFLILKIIQYKNKHLKI